MEGNQDATIPRRRRRNRARDRRAPPPAYDELEHDPSTQNPRIPSPEPLEKYENNEARQAAEISKLRAWANEVRPHPDELLRQIDAQKVEKLHLMRENRKLRNRLGDANAAVKKLERAVIEREEQLVGDMFNEEEEKESIKTVKGH